MGPRYFIYVPPENPIGIDNRHGWIPVDRPQFDLTLHWSRHLPDDYAGFKFVIIDPPPEFPASPAVANASESSPHTRPPP